MSKRMSSAWLAVLLLAVFALVVTSGCTQSDDAASKDAGDTGTKSCCEEDDADHEHDDDADHEHDDDADHEHDDDADHEHDDDADHEHDDDADHEHDDDADHDHDDDADHDHDDDADHDHDDDADHDHDDDADHDHDDDADHDHDDDADHDHDDDASASGPSKPLKQAKLLVELPDSCSTPDGMCLLPNGEIILSVPNVNSWLAALAEDAENAVQDPAPVLMKITKDNRLEKWYDPPKHPVTGTAFPFGICIDPEGKNFYMADLQWFADPANPGNHSRVLRIPLDENYDPAGDPVVVVEGMVVANAVVVRDGYLYVSDTTMVPKKDPGDPDEPLISGIFRVKLDEEGTKLTLPLIDDPHLVATMKTFNPDCGFGADGLTFDGEGNLYCGNFADGTMHKIAAADLGAGKESPVWTRAPQMKSCDGIFYDAATGKIYVADSIANAVQIVDPADGSVETLAADEENDGSGGRLDQPCEVVVRGKQVVASNMDFPVPGGVNKTWDKPYTISVIELD